MGVRDPTRTSQRQQVAAAALGAEVAVQELIRGAARTHLSRCMPAAEAGAVLAFLDDAAAGRSPATHVDEKVLGRRATGFDV